MDDHSYKNLDSQQPSNSETQDQSGASEPEGGNAQTRRRFLKAGLVSVPMIVTLRGRPAHAQVSLGSVNIFYGRYELFLNDPNAPFDPVRNPRNRWAPANQDGKEMIDPTRRSGDGYLGEATGDEMEAPKFGTEFGTEFE